MCFRKKEKKEPKQEKQNKKDSSTNEKSSENESSKVYHITKRATDGKWQVKFTHGEKAIKLFDTQQEAIDYTKTLSNNQDRGFVVHKKKGTIRKKNY